MEALHSCLTTGEQSGGQEHRKPESPSLQTKSPSEPCKQQQTGSPKHHGKLQQAKRPKRQHPERKRLRHQRQSIDSDTRLEQQHEATTAIKATQVSSLAPGVPPPSAGCPTQIKPETQEGTPKQKRERKPQRPGKYVCTYCGRACAKPSVLQKHIRSHTGERPYPCAPCGFSFKTKSNLYKHRKSHTHRVKAGLALGQPRSLEEQVTESEDETRQLSSASSRTEGPSSVTSIKKDCTGGNNDSHAVKRRLAMRLSRGKHSPRGSSDEKESSLILGSKGSTESGYFSRSESTEHSQDTPQNTSNKSYEEIILGKYGRLGHLQRMSRHQNQQPSGQEDKSIPFTVPKKQVIDHITKLITINEAVVDTSKIDSVKPRRFSLSRKNSSESQKSSSTKEPLIHNPKAGDPGYKTSGSITMGVPCEKFQNPSLNVEQPAGQTSGPLVRSQSMPSAAISFDASGCDSSKFRTSQSFDERKPSERQVSRRCGMLRRQPAIEIPLGAELTKEEHEGSHSFYPDSLTTVPDQKQSLPQLYECEACGTGCKDWEGYKKHKQTQCLVHHPRSEMLISQVECSQLINPSVRAGASIMRKRRKEESFESDDPVSPSLPPPLPVSGQCKDESNLVYEGPRRPTLHTCSVIQHTSSFENQESLCNENQGTEATKTSQTLEEFNSVPQNQPQQVSTKSKPRKLVRQYNVQVPEILVTEDSNMSAVIPIEPTPTAKHSEKPDEFQWPQRSPSLSQVPIEKLPPKKKRLRLAEAAQSSGESSFDSVSRPHSPSQDSSASYASSRSTSFEESNRPDMEKTTLTPLRKSRASHMLTVPGVHQQREMRRSASEQAPHDPQPSVLVVETRSKSFDYSCLSPERSAAGWKERRKCLLMRHTAIRDPDEEEEEQCTLASCSPQHVISTTSSLASPNSLYCSKSPASSFSEETVLSNPVRLRCKEIFPQWNVGQNTQSTGGAKGELSLTQCTSVDPVNEETSDTHAGEPHAQALQPYYTQGPSGAARAGYLPMSTGLKLEIPLLHEDYPEVRISTSNIPHPAPHITPSQELLRPVTSPTVAVRLQTDTLTLACAIYTTLSQVASPRLEEMVGAVSYNIAVPTAEYRAHGNISPNLQLWSDDGLRISGSGGNKRMLSPSHSIELPTESQQQQKRVKEEEEREVGCVDNASVVACNQELKVENPTCLPSVCTPYKHAESSFPSLLSSTCNSWCYLNYIKSNPSPLDENKPSVYSSWSTSGYDPNPPGLSSKTALSLLHCKQKRSPSIYTVSPMTIRMAESAEPEDKQRPCSLEVCRDHDGTRMGPQSAGDNRSTQKEEEKEEEEVPSRNEPPDVWNSREGGSVEKYATVQDGGGGKNRCEDYGFQVKDTTERQKCTQGLSETPEHNCKNCEAPFKAKGIYEEPLIQPDKEKDNWFSDQGERGHDEDDTTKDKEGRSDQVSRSKVPDGSASCDAEKSQQKEPEARCSSPLPPKYSTEWSSASLRRALFARRHLNASASTSSAAVLSPSNPTLPQREPSPTRPHQSPAASSSCDVSTSSVKPAGSPSRRLSPVIIQSLGSVSSGPSGSLMDKSARCHACLHPREQASTARRSVNEVGLSPVSPNPGRSWGSHNLLSHLPLHSQQLSRAPSLLIPIGGIHMIQPRSLLPLYSLVSRPKATPTGTSWRGRSSLLLRQDTLKETLPSSPSSPRDPEESGGTPGSGPSDASSQGNSHARGPQPSKTETDAYVTEGPVHPETTLGQKKAPSSQTQL